ncbi:MAG: hypothetical protein P5702_17090 [Limnospira sp. PMC 1291.21]|uniref:Uncharacterized protein n=2 Tax=Limnospira TaxID=2596745 RepID=B5W0H7_LIMMA|nr:MULTISPECIES: hypothetical protein [Limnospira]EKD06218.1 hypothetical protein SPLC1_S541630 [Arthrospira platensis C1]MDY7054900.1 hypothetical protein [Limnospira fusiformis LS22]QJB26756.1 hypothetical protein HFV01_14225 [Limnospira fusiformis SAG 85.79]EDZ94865.1 hypothetical protein AmaxDRAFT_2271 [Limnospira maxima CS-328]MDT9179202.1 hypothetical protein [Limnospira sp. PMC 1238.20]
MSSAHSGPYKSRLFNFLLSNYQQFSDACDRTWRNIRYATSATTQILLYPIYLILQNTPLSNFTLPTPKVSPSLPSAETTAKENPQPQPSSHPTLLLAIDNTIAEIEPQIKPVATTLFHNFHLWIFSTLNYLLKEPTDNLNPSLRVSVPLPDPWKTSKPPLPLTNSQPQFRLNSTSPKTRTPQLPPSQTLPNFPKLESQILEQLNHHQGSQLQLATSPNTPLTEGGSIAYSQKREVEDKPLWLETPAEAIGYVKHPLQSLIEWLDRVIAIAEQIIIKIVNWLKSSPHLSILQKLAPPRS